MTDRWAYYNEIEPFAAEWLRNLISAGHIAAGEVDERSIQDVRPEDLVSFTQCHFFAGVGVWSHALRLAGWEDDRPIWTGSCPCQPFSAAGQGGGFDDERHLWPDFFWLIDQCRPGLVLGEQVASSDGSVWLDLVQADLEGLDYTSGSIAFPAAGVGAPNIRDRLYWMAYAELSEGERQRRDGGQGLREQGSVRSSASRSIKRLADANGNGSLDGKHGAEGRRPEAITQCGGISGSERPGPVNSFWRDADWLFCTDGSWRPVEPGTFPLAYDVANRVGKLRAYGNAINARQAQVFIEAAMEVMP